MYAALVLLACLTVPTTGIKSFPIPATVPSSLISVSFSQGDFSGANLLPGPIPALALIFGATYPFGGLGAAPSLRTSNLSMKLSRTSLALLACAFIKSLFNLFSLELIALGRLLSSSSFSLGPPTFNLVLPDSPGLRYFGSFLFDSSLPPPLRKSVIPPTISLRPSSFSCVSSLTE